MKIIRDRKIVEDTWSHLADDTPVPAAGDVIVSLERWNNEREALLDRSGRLGVSLPNTTDLAEIADDLGHFALIAVVFPTYKDGRAYSIARRLRDGHGYSGEIRAIGDVLRDQLFYMERCGFDAYELKAGKNIEDALSAFDDFSFTYQDATDTRSVPRSARGRRT